MAGANGGLQLGLMLPVSEGGPPEQPVPVRWSQIRTMAKLAEDVGFDTVLLADHLLYRNAPPVSLPEGVTRGCWEAWTLLSALAEVTSRVELCPLVLCTSFRNPALLAKMADTLDEVSDGRLILGLGAGWHKPEYDAFGYPFDHLASRFEEALTIIATLLREGRIDFQGKYYQARDCELRPRGPSPRGPRLLIGAKQPRMMRLIARYADMYNTVWHVQPEAVDPHYANLRAACAEVGRNPDEIVRTAGTFVALAGPDGNMTGLREHALKGSPGQIADQLRAFAAHGVQHMTCILDPNTPEGVERFGRVIKALRT